MTETSERPRQEGLAGRFERLAEGRGGLGALFVASMLESTVVPIPLEAITLPLMLSRPARALTVALSIWLGCLLGAGAFYWVGYLLLDPVVMPVLHWLGATQSFQDMQARLSGSDFFLSVFVISVSPAPMQLATLGAGAVQGSFAIFMVAIALSRGVRYFGMAVLAQFFGDRVITILHRMKGSALVLMVVLVAIWAAIQFL